MGNVPDVETYAKKLTKRISKIKAEYLSLTTELERSFIGRLILELKTLHLPEPVKRFAAMEDRRKRLGELELLADQPRSNKLTDVDEVALSTLSESHPAVVLMYLKDMEQKLALFDSTEKKLEVFERYMNDRFLHKKFVASAETGFYFTMGDGENENDLPPTVLSSGEQHELILLYELIFETEDGDLILIDEPELSLHLSWQLTLLEDLRSTFGDMDVDVLVATHSPSILENSTNFSYAELAP